jgi:hypothetical protein
MPILPVADLAAGSGYCVKMPGFEHDWGDTICASVSRRPANRPWMIRERTSSRWTDSYGRCTRESGIAAAILAGARF